MNFQRVWITGIGLRFAEKRDKHHDEEPGGYFSGGLHVLAVRVCDVVRAFDGAEPVHRIGGVRPGRARHGPPYGPHFHGFPVPNVVCDHGYNDRIRSHGGKVSGIICDMREGKKVQDR